MTLADAEAAQLVDKAVFMMDLVPLAALPSLVYQTLLLCPKDKARPPAYLPVLSGLTPF